MENLTLEDAIRIFIEVVVGDIVHQDYHRTVSKAILYQQLATGENIDDLFIQYAPREDFLTYEYKKKVTRTITPAVISSLSKPFYKVPRTDRLVKKVQTVKGESAETDDNLPALTVLEKMQGYYGSENNVNGLDFFMQQRYIEIGITDPNTWVANEFKPFDEASGDKASSYPYEIPSERARMFNIVNNVTQWLVAREDNTYMEPVVLDEETLKMHTKNKTTAPTHEERDGFKWVMYTDMYQVILEQVGSDHFLPGEDDEAFDEDVRLMHLDNGNHYLLYFYSHLTGIVPAKRVGYKRDLSTKGRTFVAFYEDAINYLLDSIKTVADFSITKSDHVFPQKMQYVPPCPGESDLNTCFNGRASAGGICKVCNGDGKMPIHQSASDVITIKLPDDSDKIVDLNKLLVYFSPSIELVKLQNELVKQVSIDCHQTVFNSTQLLKDTTGQAATAETATSKNFDMDSINDTLAPFAEGYSSFWLFVADIISRHTGYQDQVEFIHRFPSDFKMKTIGDLYSEMKTANDSNAPVFLIEMINDDVAATKFQDDPDLLLQYEVKKRLNPFRGKTDVDVLNALNTDYTPRWKKVLSVNFEDVISMAELRLKDFYAESPDKQLEVVREITNELIAEIDEDIVTPTVKPITVPTGAIYSEGDSVTVEPGSEKDASHLGVSFKVVSVSGSAGSYRYSLTNSDGSITATYSEDDLS